MPKQSFGLLVNGSPREVNASGETPLVYLLRNDLGLKGTRFGCGEGNCGSCMVLIDGKAEKSCQTPIESIGERAIETVEGLAEGGLSAVQQAMLEGQAGQCGYCLSGIIIAATALLRANPSPFEPEVREALEGNLCRCGFQPRMIAAVLRAGEAARA